MNKSVSPFAYQLYIIGLCTLFGFFCISARLFYLQVTVAHVLESIGTKNFTRYLTIPCPRGNILDRHGVLLATNRPLCSLYWQGRGNRQLNADDQHVLETIKGIVHKSIPNSETVLIAERKGKRLLLAEDLTFEELASIVELFPDYAALHIDSDHKRFYPYGSVASHILGHLAASQEDYMGKMGLERLYENGLRGIPGTARAIINAMGKTLQIDHIEKPQTGYDVQTTLDLRIQEIAEQIFPEEFSGCLIVMDPRKGDILSLVSRPTFDPNIFINPIEQDTWDNLVLKQPFLNRAFNLYPPASLFKLVSISYALENNLIDLDSSWYCIGHIEFGGRKTRCNNKYGHGTIAMVETVAKSCNIPFFELGKKIKIDQLAHYAKKFGIGVKTGCTYFDRSGIMPTTHWKRTMFGQPWYPGETLSAMIGQSFILVTPIHMARMIAGICYQEMPKPRFTLDDPVELIPLPLHKEVRKFLKHAMHEVTKKGSGRLMGSLKNVKIRAKTGTAQVASLEKRDEGMGYHEHAWLAADCTFEDGTSIVLVILIEHAGSSRVAVQVATNFLKKYIHEIVNLH
jgi:penicillin-binding protein 2